MIGILTKKKFDPYVIVVTDRMSLKDLFFSIHGILNHHNKAIIRTMFYEGRMSKVRSACSLMRELGYIEPYEEEEVEVCLKDGSKIRNMEFKIELIAKFHKFPD